MDNDLPPLECETCGGTEFYKEAGYFYCYECQTQSQQVQEHVFEREDATINKKSTKRIQKDKAKPVDMLTSWECYNNILKGLTEELIHVGVKPEIKAVVQCLWLKYLHKNEVFDVKSDRAPRVSVLGPKKDIAILYNVKRRKRRRSRASSTTTLSAKRERSTKKRALIQSEFEELSQSQTFTQDSSMLNDTLSSLRTGSESSDNSRIEFNKYSSKELKKIMSKKHRMEHKEDLYQDLKCHRLTCSNFPASFFTGPNNLTLFTLYGILYLSMLIIGDSAQLGDFLRFIREGHVSYGCFMHFFDKDVDEKSLNLPKRHERLFSHGFFRKRVAQLAHFLKIESYLVQPDLIALCERYCEELNLPKDIFVCCEKLITYVKPKLPFKTGGKVLPNYEGRAVSFILFVLKMLYGLDGKTEHKLSEYASMISDSKTLFNFDQWLEYIQYRAHIVEIHHIPTNISHSSNLSSELYLSYLKNQEIQFKGSNRHIHGEVKDYLTILEKVLDTVYDKNGEMIFEPSLIPFTSYVARILEHANIPCKQILLSNFQTESIEHLLKPLKYLEMVGCTETKNGGANDDITLKELMYLYKGSILERKHSRKNVALKITSEQDKDSQIDEYLSSIKNKTAVKRELKVILSNWQQGNSKKFLYNQELLKIASSKVKLEGYKNSLKKYKKHYNPYERYWLNIFTNPLSYYLANKDAESILNKLPSSFKVVFRECARIVEQDVATFYSEFLVTEMYLVYLAEFGKVGKDGVKQSGDFKKTLDCCAEHW